MHYLYYSPRDLATKSGTHSETWAGGRGAPVASFVPWQEGRGHGYTSRGAARGTTEDGDRSPPSARRADGRLGSARAVVRLARAARLRAHPPDGALRQPRVRARQGDGRGLRALPAAQGRPLRGGGHGEPLRLGGRQEEEEASTLGQAPHRGPQGRAPSPQPQRDRRDLLRQVRQAPRPQDRQARARRGARPAQDGATLCALP